jgi:hypothetical protein
MSFLRAVVGYRMTCHKRNEVIRAELGMTDINVVIKKISNEMYRTFEKNTWKPNPIATLSRVDAWKVLEKDGRTLIRYVDCHFSAWLLATLLLAGKYIWVCKPWSRKWEGTFGDIFTAICSSYIIVIRPPFKKRCSAPDTMRQSGSAEQV